ncbi:unnamed protein product [Penicillium egyptiacum]|uniref:Uncharacterized protein n=1 Tax=Penicillium egyptiacum TaxID=1303716 RepID=A0A9W4K6W2_9EURO|nr:unnamed protein product [Penicillium egyptiacum]
MLRHIEQPPTQLHDRTGMTSLNTPEGQAIAFLLTCVENSQKGKVPNTQFQAQFHDISEFTINWDNVALDTGVNMTPEATRKYYFSILKNAKEFERSDKYPEIPGDPSWQSITADDAELPIIIVECQNDTIA